MSTPRAPLDLPTLYARLQAKSRPATFGGGCRIWSRAYSQSGQRRVRYPSLWVGPHDNAGGGRAWRVNRLVLVLAALPDFPRRPREPLHRWLWRVNRAHRHLEASHTCDTAACIEAGHLVWLPHDQNVSEQADRRHAAALVQQQVNDSDAAAWEEIARLDAARERRRGQSREAVLYA